LIKSPIICCLIWLLSYEGTISNPFQVNRNFQRSHNYCSCTIADTKQSSGDSGVQLYYCPFPTFSNG